MPRIILAGPGASGKDFMRKRLEERGMTYAVSYTTRPPRPGEVDGQDYFFLSQAECQQMIDAGKFYEVIDFNGWTYGTTIEQFYRDDVFIMTPSGLSHLSSEDRAKSFVIFLILQKTHVDNVLPTELCQVIQSMLDYKQIKNYLQNLIIMI